MLAGIFLGSMTMLNILGVTRFLDLSFTLFGRTIQMPLAVGVLPYPITFLCTDFISEIYGRKRANFMVWVGFLINIWLVVILWLGGVLPGFDDPVPGADGRRPLFFELRTHCLMHGPGVILTSSDMLANTFRNFRLRCSLKTIQQRRGRFSFLGEKRV